MGSLSYKIEYRCENCDDCSMTSVFCGYKASAVKDMLKEAEQKDVKCKECHKKMTFSSLEVTSEDFIYNYLKKKYVTPDLPPKSKLYKLTIVCDYCGSEWVVTRDINRGKGCGLDDAGLRKMGIACINPACPGKPKENSRVTRQFFLKAMARL